MKNLIIVLCLAILCSCTESKKNTQAATAPALTIKDVTLNGLSRAEADVLVKDFHSDRISVDFRTAVRFNKQFLENIITVLKYEKGDGVRVYFAKNKSKQNTLVLVSTRDDGPSKEHPGHHIHQDYFTHGTPLLDSADMKNIDEHDDEVKEGLYTQKPCADDEGCPRDQHYISCKQAREEALSFRKGQSIETTAVWFELALFEKLYNSLVAAEKAGKKDVGIRLYVVKGSKTETHTIVIATTENIGGVHTDFYKCFNNAVTFTTADLDNHAEECPIFCNGTTW